MVGENPTPYGILALWAVNGLSIVYWELFIVKVYGTKIQIFLGKTTQVEQKERGTGKESVQKSTLKKKTNAKHKNRKEGDKVMHEEPILHGHVCLPDYIIPQTLPFSINCFGNLQIKAKIKGAIGPLI